MQEYGWFLRNDFRDMMEVLGPHPSRRKMQLTACACIRGLGNLLSDPQSWRAIEAVEDCADMAGRDEVEVARSLVAARLAEARAQVQQEQIGVPEWPMSDRWYVSYIAGQRENKFNSLPVVWAARVLESALSADGFTPQALSDAAASLRKSVDVTDREGLIRVRTAQCSLLRDIFGNPFRPVAFSPDWRTDTAVTLARLMYEPRDFSLMPILADALQDAGCEHADVLDHCRDPNGTHVRGCWVVDLVLDKQ
jgi:hypothetical protein